MFLFRPLKSGETFVFGCVLDFFSAQNRVPQIIIGIGHITAFSAVIRTTFKFSKHLLSVQKNRFEVFDFFILISGKKKRLKIHLHRNEKTSKRQKSFWSKFEKSVHFFVSYKSFFDENYVRYAYFSMNIQ